MRRPGLSGSRRGAALLGALAALAIGVTAAATGPAGAQGTSSDTKPYDDKLMRLSEILGAVHYLRELMDTEGSSALRRARLTRSFNNGYRSYSRTYNVRSQSAQTAITRFLAEGAEIAESLAKTAP